MITILFPRGREVPGFSIFRYFHYIRRVIEDYNESHMDKISVTYGHYTRRDELDDMKRMGAD